MKLRYLMIGFALTFLSLLPVLRLPKFGRNAKRSHIKDSPSR